MSKRSLFSNALALAAAILIVIASAAGAFAQGRSLDGPRAAGTVGERYDGYAVVRDASAGEGSLVEQVNAERRKVYAERAANEKAPVDQIARVYAAEIFRSAPAGTWFLKEDGQWVRK
jgi:uncharacterized protein